MQLTKSCQSYRRNAVERGVEWPTIRPGRRRWLPTLSPVIHHVGIGPIESFRMRTLHCDALQGHTISAGTHAPIGIFTSQIHAGFYCCSTRKRKCLAGIEQRVETRPCAGATSGRTELDVACLLTAFRSRSNEANRKAIENTA